MDLKFKKYLNEIREEDLENLDLDRDLFFDNIFGDKLRISIPMGKTPELVRLINTIESLGYVVVRQDLIDKKIVYKKVQTKESTKNRPEKVGGVLQNAIKTNIKQGYNALAERIKRDLDWWQKNSSGLKNNETGSSIIISRSPIDLVRMSDHDNISSCHSPGNSFFKCAKQEARTGGAVAFVVKNSDLKNVDIQKPELFKDKQRKIDGIVPLERLRLRRFVAYSGKKDIEDLNMLVPELRTYGTKNVGFYDQVKQWATNSQKDAIDKIDPEINYHDFHLKGGSYQDSSADKIWSNFFDKEVTGHKDSLDADKEETDNVDLHNAALNQLEEHQRFWKHFSVHHDVYEENTLDYSAYCSFSIPKKLFTVELSWRAFNVDEIEKSAYNNWRAVKSIIDDSIDIYAINDIELDISDKDKYVFNISIYDESSLNRGESQLIRFEHFLDYIDEADKNFETHVSKVYKSLIDKGYIKSISEKLTFKNFEIEEDDYEGSTIKSVSEKIAYLKDFPVIKTIGGKYTDKQIYEDRGKIYINQFRNKLINSIDFKNLKIFPFNFNQNEIKFYLKEGLMSAKDTDERVTIPSVGITPAMDAVKKLSGTSAETYPITRITGWVYFEFEKTLGFNITSNVKTIQLLKNIDNNWEFYLKKLNKIFESFVKIETKGFGWTRKDPPDFSFNKSKDYPKKPYNRSKEKQLTFKNFVT